MNVHQQGRSGTLLYWAERRKLIGCHCLVLSFLSLITSQFAARAQSPSPVNRSPSGSGTTTGSDAGPSCEGADQGAANSNQHSTTVFEHTPARRYWVSGQINIIGQTHPSFPARYSGPNSLRSNAEAAASNVLTLFTGFEINERTEV